MAKVTELYETRRKAAYHKKSVSEQQSGRPNV
jgi:hypothetical protein